MFPNQVILFLLLSFSLTIHAADTTQVKGLKNYLAKYLEVQKNGSWRAIHYNHSLRIGDIDKNISAIKKRLIVLDDLDPNVLVSDTFDLPFEAAVKHFQLRHCIQPDGIVGKRTLNEMNVPIYRRIHQLEVNLKRWTTYVALNEPYIIVNIAAQEFELRDQDSVILKMKVIVGRRDRKTPVLTTFLQEIEFNPFWIIPPGIAQKDILPTLKRKPSFLASEKIHVYLGNSKINSDHINWEAIPDTVPYLFVQEPGENNPMGAIKFTFPNSYYVYFHDTPNKKLFEKDIRTFSSGCIRLSEAKELASYVLKKENIYADMIDSLVQTKRNIKVPLKRSVPVNIVYFTAWVNDKGVLCFAPDIYRRDL